MSSPIEEPKGNEGMYEIIEKLETAVGGGIYELEGLIRKFANKANELFGERYPTRYRKGTEEASIRLKAKLEQNVERLKAEGRTDTEIEGYIQSFYEAYKYPYDCFGDPKNKDLSSDPFMSIAPRITELIAQVSLFFFESVGELPSLFNGSWRVMNALYWLITAGVEYEKLGIVSHAHNIWARAYIAAERIASFDIDPVLRGVLYETMGICQLLMDRPGANECFQKSFDVLQSEHKRRILIDIAWKIEREKDQPPCKTGELPGLGRVILTRDNMDHLAPNKERRKLIDFYEGLPDQIIDAIFAEAEGVSEEAEEIDISLEGYSFSEDLIPSIKKAIEVDQKTQGIEWVYLVPDLEAILGLNYRLFNSKLKIERPEDDKLNPINTMHMSLDRSRYYLENTMGKES